MIKTKNNITYTAAQTFELQGGRLNSQVKYKRIHAHTKFPVEYYTRFMIFPRKNEKTTSLKRVHKNLYNSKNSHIKI